VSGPRTALHSTYETYTAQTGHVRPPGLFHRRSTARNSLPHPRCFSKKTPPTLSACTTSHESDLFQNCHDFLLAKLVTHSPARFCCNRASFSATFSNAATNLKVGAHFPRKTPEFFVPLHFFGCIGTISRFGERFRDGQYSSVSFLFAVLLLTVPPRVKPF